MKKIVLFLAVVSVLSPAVFAKYSGGDGTPSSPYIINNPADLIALAGDTGDYTKHFLQTSIINLLGTTRTTALIAPDTNNTSDGFQGDKFQGSYDGQGYQILNFTIDTLGGGQDYLGLYTADAAGTQTGGFAPIAVPEGAVLNTLSDVLGSAADHGDLDVVNGARAVKADRGDETFFHEVDNQR